MKAIYLRDNVAAVHDMQDEMMRASALEQSSGQRQDDVAAGQAFEPVIVETDP